MNSSNQPTQRVKFSVEGQQAAHDAAAELEQIAEEIRGTAMLHKCWQDLQPQWKRLRELEAGLRWMIEP